MDLLNFFLHGYVHSTDKNLAIERFDKATFTDCSTLKDDVDVQRADPEYAPALNELHKYMGETYIAQLFDEYTLTQCAMWSGVDSGSSVWHNDNKQGSRFTSNLLVYLDDNKPEDGNFIQVRGAGFEHTLYPKRGDFVWLNQKECFEHRAQNDNGIRRVLSFEFYIPALL